MLNGDNRTAGVATAESREWRELLKKNRLLKQNIEIFKAATSFFARESGLRHR